MAFKVGYKDMLDISLHGGLGGPLVIASRLDAELQYLSSLVVIRSIW